MSKTHYAGCEPANESDNYTHWDEWTACGLHGTEAPLTNDPKEVTCKNCLKQLNKKR